MSAGPGRPAAGRALVVDDDPGVARLLCDILAIEGLEVDTAASAEACFERLAGGGLPALILLDVMLPGIDGFETLTRLRGSAETAGIPVIMISTLPEKSYHRRAADLGAVAYLKKPFLPQELIDTVRRAVGK